MKKKIFILLSVMFLCMFAEPAMASGKPVIISQPQNPVYPEGSYATYSVEVYGDYYRCDWILEYEGKAYSLTDSGENHPWGDYIGIAYGVKYDGNVYSCYFDGIGEELNGSSVYAVFNDGALEVKSDKAIIQVAGSAQPPVTKVMAEVDVFQGDVVDLYCYAEASGNETLQYLWYETTSGQLQDIIAINRGAEELDTLHCDTSETGTRYYVCMVTTSSGGCGYTSVIPVTVSVPGEEEIKMDILRQPQNPNYQEGSYATYSVETYGMGLGCDWFLEFEGKTYDLSNTGGNPPWIPYAGRDFGAVQDGNEFSFYFDGIGKELDGASIFAVINDGHHLIESAKAYVSVSGTAEPPKTYVPARLEVYQGDIAELYCFARTSYDQELSYLWYETSSGRLQDIIAIDRGAEVSDTLRCDTGEVGTRYYVCMVTTPEGGSTYTSVIPVTVHRYLPSVEAPVIESYSIPDAVVGEEYYFTLDCSDPDAAFSIYYESSGSNDFFETGLNLTQHGSIEGIPEKAGTYTFTVCASGEGGEGYMTYTLNVKEAYEPKIELLEAPDKTVYTYGECLDLKGLKVRIYQSDGTYFDSLDGEGLTVTTSPLMTLGERRIKVYYGDTFDIFFVKVVSGEIHRPGRTDKLDRLEKLDEFEVITRPPRRDLEDSEEVDEQTKSGIPWGTVLLILLGCAGIGGGAVFVLRKKKK